MAGFLRKKNKDAPVKQVPSSPIPLGAAVSSSPPPPPPAVPPLFARFATSTKIENGVSAGPRIVSSPKVLSSNVKKDLPQKVPNRANGQTTPTGGAKKRSSQNQVPSKPLTPVQSAHVLSEQHRPLTPPAPIVNKPLPPPSPPASTTADPSGSAPTQSFIPSNRQSRPPPSVSKNQPLNGHVDSSSSSFRSFSSAQSFNTPIFEQASRRPSTSNSFTSPSKRNPQLSNTNLPSQILPPIANRKMIQQIPPPPAFGRQNLLLPTTTQTQMQQHLSRPSSVANQDLHPANVNANIPMSMIGASSTQMGMQQLQQSGIQGGQVSDRSDIDLPPEFAAMFHNFNQQFNLEDRNSANSINSNEHVPASNVPRSPDGKFDTSRPSISTTGPEEHPLPPPPPPKTTESDMGVASSSHAIGNGLPSSTKDFYSPRVNGRTSSSYNSAANQPQMLNRRHSPPPPLPSVTASPLQKQDKFPPRSEVSNRTSNRTSQHPSSQDPNNLQNSGFLSSSSSPPSARKSILHSQVAPTAGKPRIFAMTAQVDELDASFSGTPPPPPSYSAKKQQQPPLQSTMQVQQPQPQYQPSATNGSDSFKPVFSASSSVKPPSTAFKFPTNHNNSVTVVERQQQQLPPTPPTPPPTHYRGESHSSRQSISTIPDEDDDVERPQSQHVLSQTTFGSRSRKNSRSDEEPRPQSQNILQSPGSRSRKNSKSDEQPRPQSQNILLQAFGSRSRKNSKVDEESRPQSLNILQPPGSRSRKNSKSSEQQQRPQSQNITPRTPPSRTRKLSKHRPEVASQYGSISEIVLPGTPDSQHHHRRTSSIKTLMTKSRPTTPVAGSAAASAHKASLFGSPKSNNAPLEPAIQLDEDTRSKAGILLDDDPFARVEGVTMLRPLSSFGGDMEEGKDRESVVGGSNEKKLGHRKSSSAKGTSISSSHVGTEEKSSSVSPPVVEGVAPPTPVSPEEHRKTKKKKKKKRHDEDSQTESTLPVPMLDSSDPAAVTSATAEEPEPELEPEPEPEPILPLYTIIDFLSDPQLLSSLLTFFSFYDWCLLSSLSKEIRILLVQSPALRETVLERFLKTVGYSRWLWDDPDPLSLSLQDLNDYMRGVSTPTHEYARVAGMYVHSLTIHPNHRDPSLIDIVRVLTASTRAYTRVILRLRAQAEKEAILVQQSRGLGITMKASFNNNNYPPPSSSVRGNHSRVSSRAPSPTTSNGAGSSSGGLTNMQERNSLHSGLTFRSPLFRLRRAPLLRVFVPSPEGDWLSDKSVLACEEECKRAGVMHLIRLGDVVWDVAVGDEGNVGRLVWDGSYLIDLDYTYTSIGDLPKYIPALAFPPSYFHRVIRTGPVISNPIVHIDISPWGEEIAMNLQLLQDRVRTETPQGAYHNVVRWVHRSSFVIRPGPARFASNPQGGNNKTQMLISRVPIPDTDHLFVDSGWHGTVVVETEGTNEALADLQERCGPGVFPPRSRGVVSQHHPRIQMESKKVFRVLREKSRPGEIWIKTVGIKERIM